MDLHLESQYMVPVFHPRLVNDPFGDPCLYIDIQRETRAILFDLGSLESLEPAKLLRVSDVFVSHTHIDHFIGFDHLLRLFAGRDKRLRIFGPPGIIRNLEGKLAAYTWNLVEGYSFYIEVYEVSEKSVSTARFMARESFKRTEEGDLCDRCSHKQREQGQGIKEKPSDCRRGRGHCQRSRSAEIGNISFLSQIQR